MKFQIGDIVEFTEDTKARWSKLSGEFKVKHKVNSLWMIDGITKNDNGYSGFDIQIALQETGSNYRITTLDYKIQLVDGEVIP